MPKHQSTEPAKNEAAVALGKLNKGVKKNLTEEQRQACRDRLNEVRKRRWVDRLTMP